MASSGPSEDEVFDALYAHALEEAYVDLMTTLVRKLRTVVEIESGEMQGSLELLGRARAYKEMLEYCQRRLDQAASLRSKAVDQLQ